MATDDSSKHLAEIQKLDSSESVDQYAVIDLVRLIGRLDKPGLGRPRNPDAIDRELAVAEARATRRENLLSCEQRALGRLRQRNLQCGGSSLR